MEPKCGTVGRPAIKVLALSGLSSFVVIVVLSLGSMGLVAPEKAQAQHKYDYKATVYGAETNNHAVKVSRVYYYYGVTLDQANSSALASFANEYPYPTYTMTSATIIRIK